MGVLDCPSPRKNLLGSFAPSWSSLEPITIIPPKLCLPGSTVSFMLLNPTEKWHFSVFLQIAWFVWWLDLTLSPTWISVLTTTLGCLPSRGHSCAPCYWLLLVTQSLMLKGSWVTGQALSFPVHGCHPVSWLLIPGVCCCVSNGLFQSSLLLNSAHLHFTMGVPTWAVIAISNSTCSKQDSFLPFTLQTCPSPTVFTFSIIGSCVPQAAWAEALGLCLTPVSHTPQLTCRWTLSASPTSFQHSPLLLLASSIWIITGVCIGLWFSPRVILDKLLYLSKPQFPYL